MPQLVKGGKWVFGWVIVGSHRELHIPPAAWAEYGFRAGEPVAFLHGSRRSGGLSIGRCGKLERHSSPLMSRRISEGEFGAGGWIEIPPAIPVKPGDRLLVVRGSGLALGFVQKGPIFEEALKHPGVETFLGEI